MLADVDAAADQLVAGGLDVVAALAVDVMANTTVTGATYDVDGGEQLLARRCERRPNRSGSTPSASP
jgi:hypothetical protein